MQRNASSSPQRIVASGANNSVVVTLGPFTTGSSAVMVAWPEDAAGNVGPSAVLTWEVDLTSPVTEWMPFDPPALTNRTTMAFSFGCSSANCSFDYAFGSSARVRLGGGANATAGGGAVAVAVVDTVLGSLPPRLTTLWSATVAVAAVVDGRAVVVNSSSGNTTAEMKLDAGPWTDVRQYGGVFDDATVRLSLSGLSDGAHTRL